MSRERLPARSCFGAPGGERLEQTGAAIAVNLAPIQEP